MNIECYKLTSIENLTTISTFGSSFFLIVYEIGFTCAGECAIQLNVKKKKHSYTNQTPTRQTPA